jgi:hypothetical protein
MWQVRRSACFIDQRATRRAVALTSPGLSGDTRSQLALLWGPAMVRASDLDRHRDVVDYLGQVLHDQFFCRLAHWIPEQQVGQVIFVPDMLTRHLPLHLARVCSKDIVIPDVSTEGAEYFCEVLPVEYAPCVQAVALSQHQRRPPNIARGGVVLGRATRSPRRSLHRSMARHTDLERP